VVLGLDLCAIYKPEKIYVKNVNLAQGLSQCVVTDILQDAKGFIWASTFDGLNRYDGQNLKVYRHSPDDPTSLVNSKIHRLTTDDRNHLYLITSSGFSIFDCSLEKTLKPPSLGNTKIQWLHRKGNNEMWVYEKNKGLGVLQTDRFELKYIPQAASHTLRSPLLDILTTKDEVYLIGSQAEVVVYHIGRKDFKHYLYDNKENWVFNSTGLDKYGNVLFGSRETDMMVFNRQTGTFGVSDLVLQNDLIMAITDMAYDPKLDVLFLSSYGQGLFVFDYATKQIHQFKKNQAELAIANNFPGCLQLDEQGNLLVGYDGVGFDILDPHIKQFVPIVKDDPVDLKALRFIRKIVEGNGNSLYIGTSGSGLIRYDRAFGSFEFFNNKNTKTFADNFIIEMARIENDLYLGFNGAGVGVVDINTVQLKQLYKMGKGPNDISNGTIWSFLPDDDHTLWVGTRENGMNKIHLPTRTVKQLDTAAYPAFANNGMRCLFNYNKNELLIGTERGLYLLHKKSLVLKKLFPLKENEIASFSSIKCITQDAKKRIWLGTDGSGIVILNAGFEMIRNFNSNNYLTSGVVYSLLPENDSTFWSSTNAGLSRVRWNESSLQPQGSITITNYDMTNGLQANEFNTGAYAKLSDGSMAFGGINGINIFKPEDINATAQYPKTYINEFKVFENSYYKGTNVSYLNNIDLKHYENSVSISFSTLGFVLPEKIKYRYRLIGHEKEWIPAGNRSYISYTNLGSGDYEFQVKACNSDGVWSDTYTSLRISIATPFYRTWWFISLMSITAGFIAYQFYYYRMRQIREKESLRIQYNKDLAEVEMKALRAQINPHFLFNSLNSINNYILKNDTRKASRYLVKFSQLVRNILNNSSNSYITLQEELQTVELYMLIEGMRFNDQFSYHIENIDDINTANVTIPSLLLQPYVENAIWHGLLHKEEEKLITIRIEGKLSDDFIVVNIIDNGVGREKAEEIEERPKHRKSYGMQLGENRLKLMSHTNGKQATVEVIDLMDKQQQPAGTQIKIVIPETFYKKENLLNS
jgi:ligand-binding sensor domain-containing protein